MYHQERPGPLSAIRAARTGVRMSTTEASVASTGSDSIPEQSWLPDQLVVSTMGAALISGYLGEWGCATTVDADPALGLSRLVMARPQAALDGARETLRRAGRHAHGHAPRHREPEPPVRPDDDPCDTILRALRHRSRSGYAGWAPVMGKNRLLTQIGPTQTIGVGGDGAVVVGGQTVGRIEADPARLRFSLKEGAGVTVGMLDTTVVRHPFIAGHLDPRSAVLDLTPADAPGVPAWHGTFVAG